MCDRYDYGGSGNFPVYAGGTALCYDKLKAFLDIALPPAVYPSDFYFSMLDHVTNNDYLLQTEPVPSGEEIQLFFDTFDDTMAYLRETTHADIEDYDLWVQIYNQTAANARNQLLYGPACNFDYSNCENIEYLLNNRDSQMADNLVWYYTQNMGSQVRIIARKIIVWTHSSHAMREAGT
jgi:hypothetical protein